MALFTSGEEAACCSHKMTMRALVENLMFSGEMSRRPDVLTDPLDSAVPQSLSSPGKSVWKSWQLGLGFVSF